MKTLRVVKKLKGLTPKEEREAAIAVNSAGEGLGIVCAYLEQEIIVIDQELSSTSSLYDRPGADTYVAALLAKREASFKLLNLLRSEVTLDGDQPED